MADTKYSENPWMNQRIGTLIMRGMSATGATAQARTELAQTVGAQLGDEHAAAHLLRAAAQTNRVLGLTEDTPEARADRERERQDRVRVCLAAMGA